MSTAELPVSVDLTGRAALRALPGMLRRLLPMMILDGVCPILLYIVLQPRFAPTSAIPLATAALFPLLGNVLNIVRHRRLDTMGVLIMVSLLASLAVLFFGANPRVLLLTRNVMMPAMGVACLVSLLLPKPLAFYMVRQFLTGDTPQPGATFDTFWRAREVRVASRFMTAVWGLVMLGEFALRVIFVLTLPVVQVLALSSVIMMSAGLGLGVWNVAYGLRVFRNVRRLSSQSVEPAQQVSASQPLAAGTEP
jgi:hypothetical protein